MAVLARRAGSTPAGWLRAGAIGASVLLMSGLVTVRSQSAFTDTTENSGNFVNTGTVVPTTGAAFVL